MRGLLPVALILAIATPVGADHCFTYETTAAVVYCTQWSTGNQYPGACAPGDVAGTYYVVQDNCQHGCIFSIWVYEESNGLAGLQRGDEVVDDTCHGMILSDTVVF